jgi:hypothetical protein
MQGVIRGAPKSCCLMLGRYRPLEGGPAHRFFFSLERFIWLGLETSIAE